MKKSTTKPAATKKEKTEAAVSTESEEDVYKLAYNTNFYGKVIVKGNLIINQTGKPDEDPPQGP